jgi:hypothetical protein
MIVILRTHKKSGQTVPTFDLNGGKLAAPKSSSASRLTAGAFGFLTFTQCGERPEPSGAAKLVDSAALRAPCDKEDGETWSGFGS